MLSPKSSRPPSSGEESADSSVATESSSSSDETRRLLPRLHSVVSVAELRASSLSCRTWRPLRPAEALGGDDPRRRRAAPPPFPPSGDAPLPEVSSGSAARRPCMRSLPTARAAARDRDLDRPPSLPAARAAAAADARGLDRDLDARADELSPPPPPSGASDDPPGGRASPSGSSSPPAAIGQYEVSSAPPLASAERLRALSLTAPPAPSPPARAEASMAHMGHPSSRTRHRPVFSE